MTISQRLQSDKMISHNELHPVYNENSNINIEISSACNLNCIYCMYDALGNHKQKTFIEDDLFYRVTKEAFDLGIRSIGLYTTAEPLLNPKIYDYIAYLKKTGYSYIYISTNGILCTPKNFIKLVDAGIDSIKFSVSAADRETYQRHHGVDAFDMVKENILHAAKYKAENKLDVKLYAFYIITRFNLNEKDAFYKTFENCFDEIVCVPVLNNLKLQKGLDEYMSVQESSDEFKQTFPCPQIFNHIRVSVDGFLCACCNTCDLTKVADLHKMSLKDAVSGERMVTLREKHLSGDLSGTFCDFCINGKKDPIYSMMDPSVPLKHLEPVDMTMEIKKRFGME